MCLSYLRNLEFLLGCDWSNGCKIPSWITVDMNFSIQGSKAFLLVIPFSHGFNFHYLVIAYKPIIVVFFI